MKFGLGRKITVALSVVFSRTKTRKTKIGVRKGVVSDYVSLTLRESLQSPSRILVLLQQRTPPYLGLHLQETEERLLLEP